MNLTRLLLRHPGRLAALLGCSAVTGILGWAVALFLQRVVDRSAGPLALFAAGVVIAALVRSAVLVVRQTLQLSLSRRIQGDLSSRYLDRLLRLEMRGYDACAGGDLIRRLRGLEHVRQIVGDRVLGLLFDAVLVAGAFAVLCGYGVSLALLALGGALFPALAILAIQRPAGRSFDESQAADGRLIQGCIDALKGIRDVKLAGAEAAVLARLEADHEAGRRARDRHALQLGSVQALNLAFTTAATVLILLVGAGRVGTGALTPGGLVFVFAMAGMLLGPLEQLAGLAFLFGETRLALRRCAEILELPVERAGSGVEPAAGSIRLEGVTFGYDPARPVLRDVSLEIPAGTSLAIVGESGSGKSTLLALLAGLHAPDRGRIRVDGADLRATSLPAWRRMLGAVFHPAHLFDGTVADNIRFGRPGATDEEVRSAAREARAEEFLLRRPLGYATPVTRDGSAFSSGQAQRIALARALVRRPKVLLLDEATNHLDAATEQAVWDALADARRTTVFVAHRLASTLRADRVAVLDEGRIVECGPPGELLERDGPYRRLWLRQGGPVPGSAFRAARNPDLETAPLRGEVGE